ncbi:hypothetical protein B0H19DRAFT_1248823 [Mycena capillaripes]|nr:hypothetical protein B0H19DRAFT_1248823 [Mycena capillaripes]
MLSFLSLAALLLTTAASPVSFVTSFANLTALAGNTVRIVDTNAHSLIVDTGYPQGPEFTPVNGSPALPTTSMTNEDWVLVPVDSATFKIQSANFPSMFISYASFGAPANIPSHSQLILRGNANAALFSLQTLAGGTTVNIVVAATGKVVTSWTTTLVDTSTVVTVTDLQAGSVRQTFSIAVIGKYTKRL